MTEPRPLGRCLVTGATGFVGRRLVAALEGPVVVLSGDMPLLRPETLRGLVDTFHARTAAGACLTSRAPWST